LVELHTELVRENAPVRFLTVYVAEAHADDEWPIGSERWRVAHQHRTLPERADVARRAERELGLADRWPTLLDGVAPDDTFTRQYGAWPTRFYIFRGRRLVWVADPHQCAYYVHDIREALRAQHLLL
jgi:hypothetical protein